VSRLSRSNGAARAWLLAFTLAAASVVQAVPGSSQQPVSTLSGVVRDAGSGAPVAGALVSLGERGPRAIADAQGAFSIAAAPLGEQMLSVERFGYVRLELRVTVTPTSEPLELRLDADPLQLQGLTVTGAATVSLSGVVSDAVTGVPLPGTSLLLTPDAVRETAEDTADRTGVFSLRNVPTGAYLLRVQRLGYVSQYVPVAVKAPSDPLHLRLHPDSVVVRGLVEFHRQLRSRRNGYLGIAVAYDEERLSYSGSPDAVHFLEYHTWVTPTPCDEGMRSSVCVLGRGGRVTEARVFIDELPVMGADQLDVLHSYRPQDFYLVEVFGTSVIRAYTHDYADRQARRPRLMLPPER
jgi:hypothetical protein